jgi:hypothetical protein
MKLPLKRAPHACTIAAIPTLANFPASFKQLQRQIPHQTFYRTPRLPARLLSPPPIPPWLTSSGTPSNKESPKETNTCCPQFPSTGQEPSMQPFATHALPGFSTRDLSRKFGRNTHLTRNNVSKQTPHLPRILPSPLYPDNIHPTTIHNRHTPSFLVARPLTIAKLVPNK